MRVLQQMRTASKKVTGTELQRAFKRFDLNGDRKLTVKELLAALLSLGVTTGTVLCKVLCRSALSAADVAVYACYALLQWHLHLAALSPLPAKCPRASGCCAGVHARSCFLVCTCVHVCMRR
jgi:hypothetical protein